MPGEMRILMKRRLIMSVSSIQLSDMEKKHQLFFQITRQITKSIYLRSELESSPIRWWLRHDMTLAHSICLVRRHITHKVAVRCENCEGPQLTQKHSLDWVILFNSHISNLFIQQRFHLKIRTQMSEWWQCEHSSCIPIFVFDRSW